MANKNESTVQSMREAEKKIDDLATKIKNDVILCLENNLNDLKTELHNVLINIGKLEKKVNQLEDRIDNIETADRLCDLVVTGIPINTNENVMNIIKLIGDSINYNIDGSICQVFRIKPKSAKHRIAPPIIIKFSTKGAAIDFFRKYREKKTLSLKDVNLKSSSRIYINGGLTAKNNAIFNEAKKIQAASSINKVYVKSGLIYAIKSSSTQPVMLKCIEDVISLCEDKYSTDITTKLGSTISSDSVQKSTDIKLDKCSGNSDVTQKTGTTQSDVLQISSQAEPIPSTSSTVIEKRNTRTKSSSANK